jgi:predicted anti-sigma-YlaC factor YlaD
MDCKDLVELVTAYLEGDLSSEDRARADEHLARCDGCARYLDQIRETIRLTGTLEPEQIPEEQRSALLGAFRDWAGNQG